MIEIKFRDIAYKGVFYSKNLDKYYVSESCRHVSGVTNLSLLFNCESERGIEDILSSTHFINTVGEQYWDRDWVKIGDIQYTGRKDMDGTEIYDGDLLEVDHGDRIAEVYWNDYISGFDTKPICINSSYPFVSLLPAQFDYRTRVIGNKFENIQEQDNEWGG